MTAMERIKEIESYFPAVPGTKVPIRYESSFGAISMNVVQDMEFLLKAFRVMQLIACQFERTETAGIVTKEFEERMK